MRSPWIIKFHSISLKSQFRLMMASGGGVGKNTWEIPTNERTYLLNQPLCLNCVNSRTFYTGGPDASHTAQTFFYPPLPCLQKTTGHIFALKIWQAAYLLAIKHSPSLYVFPQKRETLLLSDTLISCVTQRQPQKSFQLSV